MNNLLITMPIIMLLGLGATAIMDVWLLLLQKVGIPGLNFAFLGRWVGHILRGQWFHQGMATAQPIRGELVLGWFSHYIIGILFAFLLISITGPIWLRQPSLLPALLTGMATVVAPLLIMQPAMGAGIASRKTATPLKNCLKSLLNHSVFGIGLYLTALFIKQASIVLTGITA